MTNDKYSNNQDNRISEMWEKDIKGNVCSKGVLNWIKLNMSYK